MGIELTQMPPFGCCQIRRCRMRIRPYYSNGREVAEGGSNGQKVQRFKRYGGCEDELGITRCINGGCPIVKGCFVASLRSRAPTGRWIPARGVDAEGGKPRGINNDELRMTSDELVRTRRRGRTREKYEDEGRSTRVGGVALTCEPPLN